MMLRALSRFLFGTLRGRLILGVATVHAVMMTLFIVDLTSRQRAFLLDRQVEQATALSQALATSAAGWIASNDIAGLQEIVDIQRGYPGVLFVVLTDADGYVLADTDTSKVGRFVLDLPQDVRQTVLSRSPALVDIAAPAMIAERHVGWVRVGLGQEAAEHKLAKVTRSGVYYAFAAIVVGSVIAWFMGRRITRRLYAVQETIDAVRSGNRRARSLIAGDDEAAFMAREFNSMLDALAEKDMELSASEERYRSLIHKVQTAIVLHDGRGRILMSNPLAQKLLGLTENQLLGKALIDPEWHFLQEDGSILPVAEYPVSLVLSTRQPLKSYLTGISRPDRGDVSWVLVNAEPEFDDRGEIALVIVSFVDITERKRAEAEIQALAKFPAENPNPVLRASGEGVLLYANRASQQLLRLWGCSVGGRLTDQLCASVREALNAATLKEEEMVCGERLFALTFAPIIENGYVNIYGRDITERKRAEQAIHEAQQVFRTLVENSQDIIARYDRTCRRTYVNPVYLRVAQIPRQELLATSPLERSPLPEPSAAVLQSVLIKVLETGVPTSVDLPWPRPDNSETWYDIHVFPEFDREGKVVSVMSVSRDITDRKRAEEEVRKLNRELDERVKMRTAQLEAANKELEAFAYSVSHDLRAPLRSIDGFSHALLDDCSGQLNEKGMHYLNRVRASAQQMARLIDDILSLSRVTRGELRMEEVNLSDLAQEIAGELSARDPQRKVDFTITPGLVVTGDSRYLRIALENLMGNAWKFTSKRAEAKIEVGVTTHEGSLEYFVRDNGAGFDMQYAGQLFGAFQRLHSAEEFPGSGIGLATVQRIIHRHRGYVRAEGQEEQGATFYFTVQ